MHEYRFYEGKVPSAYRYNFEQYLFNREEYRLLQSESGWVSFYVLNERDLLIEAHIHFYVRDGRAQSIIQSPFGGIEWSDRIDNKTLFGFIEFACEHLKEKDVKRIVVVNPPQAYETEKQALIETFFSNTGFSLSTAEVGSVMPVTARPFSDILHPRKSKKLKQTITSNFEFRILDTSWVVDVYRFIESHRKEKDYVLSITLDHLIASVKKLNQAYKLFGVFHEGKLVAASVAVQVSSTILYHFISDHIRKIVEARPALLLMNGIYDYCTENGISLLDLGTSAKESLPNFKLIKFKSELGGQITHKFTFTKNLV
ncbi:MAG TPA: hypothetical protein VGD40_20965 [Chryseosolibacter sp.]